MSLIDELVYCIAEHRGLVRQIARRSQDRSEASLISDATSENMPIFDYTSSLPLGAPSTLPTITGPAGGR